MPFDNQYNRKLAEEVLKLNQQYVNRDKKSSLTGGDFMSTIGSLAPLALLALGKPKPKGGNRLGPPQGSMSGNMDYGFTGTRIGQGTSAGIKKYKKKMKSDEWEGGADIAGYTKDASNTLQGFGTIEDIANDVSDVAHGVGSVANFLGLAKPKKCKCKCGKGMSAGGMSAGGMSAGGMSAGGMSAGAVDLNLNRTIGGKKKVNKPKSPWIKLVQEVSKKLGTGVKEAIAYIKKNNLY